MIEMPYKCNANTRAANTLIKTPKYDILKCITTDMFLLLLNKKLGFLSLVLNVWNIRSPPPPAKKKRLSTKTHFFTDTTT